MKSQWQIMAYNSTNSHLKKNGYQLDSYSPHQFRSAVISLGHRYYTYKVTPSKLEPRISFLSVVTLYPSILIVIAIAVEESKNCQHQLQGFFEGPNQKFPLLLRACRTPSPKMKQKIICSLFVFAFLAPFFARSENVGWRAYFNEERQALVH